MIGSRPGRLWKCRAVENEENQNQVSLRFPPPLEIATTAIPTFPQPRRRFLYPKLKTERSPASYRPSGSSFDEKMLRPRIVLRRLRKLQRYEGLR